jgi:hypothetical protein
MCVSPPDIIWAAPPVMASADARQSAVCCAQLCAITARRANRRRGQPATCSGGQPETCSIKPMSVRKGQLVIHAMDAFAGAVGISDSDGKCTPEYIVCNPRRGDIVPGYYARILRFAAQLRYIEVACLAVRERAPRLRYPNFASMQLPVPPADEQESNEGGGRRTGRRHTGRTAIRQYS